MEEFFRSYGAWILLGVVFFALHRFGMGCGGGHRHDSRREEESANPDEKKEPIRSGH